MHKFRDKFTILNFLIFTNLHMIKKYIKQATRFSLVVKDFDSILEVLDSIISSIVNQEKKNPLNKNSLCKFVVAY
jgi:uncharacterized protein (DUF1778 family)